MIALVLCSMYLLYDDRKPCDSFKPYDSVNQENRKLRRKCQNCVLGLAIKIKKLNQIKI